VIAVLVLEDADQAVPLALALMAGGVSAMELTLRTASAFESLKRIRREVPDMIAGVGTVLRPDQVIQAAHFDAAFAVAPGTNGHVIKQAIDIGIPFAPGVCTPSDIEAALEWNCRTLKFFPAEAMGGVGFLRTLANPYAHLGLQYIPLGGINASNSIDYLSEPLVHSIGGSWIAPQSLIQQQDWSAITANARQAAAIVAQVRQEDS
jgi:2-dehydro-3-deoxyphosphogluconate aldolase/(4S)-4-hydroxy-2-oxoglutarate aldolase